MKLELINQRVNHKNWGAGVIEGFDKSNGHIIIKFDGTKHCGKESFPFPGIFEKENENGEKYMTFDDPQIQEDFISMIGDINLREELCCSVQTQNMTNVKKASVSIQIDDAQLAVTEGHFRQGVSYGTRGQDVYDAGVSLGLFDESLRTRFGKQQDMYAKQATKEGYSVWMLTHSSLNGTQAKDWENLIIGEEIHEKCLNTNIDIDGFLGDVRVIFAKTTKYEFLGVYKCYEIDEVNRVRKYKMISDCY